MPPELITLVFLACCSGLTPFLGVPIGNWAFDTALPGVLSGELLELEFRLVVLAFWVLTVSGGMLALGSKGWLRSAPCPGTI